MIRQPGTRRQHALQELRKSAKIMGDAVLRDSDGRPWRDVVRTLNQSAKDVHAKHQRRLSELEEAASTNEGQLLHLTELRDSATTESNGRSGGVLD